MSDTTKWLELVEAQQKKIIALETEVKTLKEQLREWDEERVPRLSLVGELIRNDWSGTEFDGRDMRDWIDFILEGKYEEFDAEVKPLSEDSILYQEIMKRKEIK